MATKDEPSSQSEAENENSELNNSVKRKAELEEIEVDVAAPEPPSKRARRALKKGKALPAKAGSDDDEKDGTIGEKEKKGKTRSEHSVWVGNLPFTLTPLELRQWLIDNSGEVITIEKITRIKLPTSKDPARDKSVKAPNKGFAYVDFTDIGGKVAAIALSETELNGRRLLIKDAVSFEGRPKKEPEPDAVVPGEKKKSEVDPNASRKVFVGNMSFKTTDDDLWRNFEKCGEIEWVKVASFEDSGKCKGFGWVKFKEPEAANWAVKGFVKIKEAIETEDDFKEKSDDEKEEEEEEKKDKNKGSQKQFKTRKWWVNRMLGRELKIELAEDDQVRYKKRFGKDAKKSENDGNKDGRRPPRRNRDDGENGGAADGASNKPLKTSSDIAVARLTGAVVEHTGTKVTFD